MLRKLRLAYCTPLYIQLWENRIKATNFKSGEVFDDQPWIAILTTEKGQRMIQAIGYEAPALAADNIRVVNPLSHPRTLIGDVETAIKLLQHAVQQVRKSASFFSSSVAVIHPMEKTEGGLTDAEIQAFRELALSAGITKVHIHQGTELNASSFDINVFNKNVKKP